MHTMWQDVTYAVRLLRASPLFTLTAVLSLGVGIAGNAAIFSVADALLLRPLPVIADTGRLVDVGRTQDGAGFDNTSYPNYVDYRDRNTVFEGLAGVRLGGDAFGLGAEDGAERVQGTAVSANYFRVLGVSMALGRAFRDDEDRVGGASAVAVISDRLWRDRFGGRPGIVGETIRLNGRPITVIGIAPPGFVGHNIAAIDLWIPLTLRSELVGGDSRLYTMRAGVWMMAIGRLRPGVTLSQARAQMNQIAANLEREYPDDNRGNGIALAPWSPVPGGERGSVAGFVGLLFTLVGLILLIACTNVGSMLLARGVVRAREVAVRLALGAARGRVVRQLATESLVLAAGGALAGVAGAMGLIQVRRRSDRGCSRVCCTALRRSTPFPLRGLRHCW